MRQDKIITSLRNKSIKNLIRLRDRKSRRITGLTIVEGIREVSRAYESGINFKDIFICREYLSGRNVSTFIKNLHKKCQSVVETSRNVFEKISFGDRHEGVLAVVYQPKKYLKEVNPKKNSLFIIAEGIEKPGNLGAILRTCDATGVDGMLVCESRTDIYNPNVIRSSMGTVFTVPVYKVSSQDAFDFLRKHNIKILATTLQCENIYTHIDMTGFLAVVVGSEQEGLRDFWIKRSDFQAKIPMNGTVDSLNVAITASVVIYEAVRQREK